MKTITSIEGCEQAGLHLCRKGRTRPYSEQGHPPLQPFRIHLLPFQIHLQPFRIASHRLRILADCSRYCERKGKIPRPKLTVKFVPSLPGTTVAPPTRDGAAFLHNSPRKSSADAFRGLYPYWSLVEPFLIERIII